MKFQTEHRVEGFKGPANREPLTPAAIGFCQNG